MAAFDLVTVYYNQPTADLFVRLRAQVAGYEAGDRFDFTAVDNTVDNRGFAKGCNYGAALGKAPFIGFLNPDLVVRGPFLDAVERVFDEQPDVVVTGSSFGKPRSHLLRWGVRDWVCGAAFFVRRTFFEAVGGFDEQFVWAWEETDLCRRAEAMGMRVLAVDDQLPFEHRSPGNDSAYKRRHFSNGCRLYYRKWRRGAVSQPHYAAASASAGETSARRQDEEPRDDTQPPSDAPHASIVIATYGDLAFWDRLARRALASARAQDVPVEVIRHHGATLARARNEAAARATTDWLCFLDADDELPSDYIRQSLAGAGDVRVPRVMRHVGRVRTGPVRLPPCDLLRKNYIVVGALTRRALFERVGGFAEWPMFEDWELWIRAMKSGADIQECPAAVYHAYERLGSRNRQSKPVKLSTYAAIRRLHLANAKG